MVHRQLRLAFSAVPYTVLAHTADTGIEASASSLVDLITELVLGMFSLMADPPQLEPIDEARILVHASSTEDLVVDVLSELLYSFEVDEMIPTTVDVSMAGANDAYVKAGWVPMAEVEMTGPPIKAVTYHALVVGEATDGWYGRVYFDV